MTSFNKVILIGNLTKDPTVATLDSGSTKGTMRLAVTERYTTQGQEHKDTCFIDVVAWNRLAEVCRDHLSKGAPILVEGKLRYSEWEADGEKRSRHTITASRIVFMPRTAPQRSGDNDADNDEGSGVPDTEANGSAGSDNNTDSQQET
jgi:single-strand DNA-binding protein